MEMMDIDIDGVRGDLLAMEELVESRGWAVLMKEIQQTHTDTAEHLFGLQERIADPDGECDPRDIMSVKVITAEQRRLRELIELPGFLIDTWKKLLETELHPEDNPPDDSEGMNNG